MTTQIWAHRGASDAWPENTLPAFDLARELGADGVELDVHRSADGVLVVCHDETIDRTSTGSGRIVDLSYAQIAQADAGGDWGVGVRIPRLADVFDLLKSSDLVVDVELKTDKEPYPGMAEQVADLVDQMSMSERVVISSFNHDSLRELSDAGCRLPLGYLYAWPVPDAWEAAKHVGASAIHPMHTLVDAHVVARCHEVRMAVRPWTCDTEDEILRPLALGVDAIITNHPELGLRLRERETPLPA